MARSGDVTSGNGSVHTFLTQTPALTQTHGVIEKDELEALRASHAPLIDAVNRDWFASRPALLLASNALVVGVRGPDPQPDPRTVEQLVAMVQARCSV